MASSFSWDNVAAPSGGSIGGSRNAKDAQGAGYERALKTLTESLQGGFNKVDEVRDERAINTIEQAISGLDRGKKYDQGVAALKDQILASGNPTNGNQRYLDKEQRTALNTVLTNQKAAAQAGDARVWKGITDKFSLNEEIKKYGTSKALIEEAQGALAGEGATRAQQDLLTKNLKTYWDQVTNPDALEKSKLDSLIRQNTNTTKNEKDATDANYVNSWIGSGIISDRGTYDIWQANKSTEGPTDVLDVYKEVAPLVGNKTGMSAVQMLLKYANDKGMPLSKAALRNVIGYNLESNYTPLTDGDFDFDMGTWSSDNSDAAKKMIDEMAIMNQSADTFSMIENSRSNLGQAADLRLQDAAAGNLRAVQDSNRLGTKGLWDKNDENYLGALKYQSGQGKSLFNEQMAAIYQDKDLWNRLKASNTKFREDFAPDFEKQMDAQTAGNTAQLKKDSNPKGANLPASAPETAFDKKVAEIQKNAPPIELDDDGNPVLSSNQQAVADDMRQRSIAAKIAPIQDKLATREQELADVLKKTDPESQERAKLLKLQIYSLKRQISSHQ